LCRAQLQYQAAECARARHRKHDFRRRTTKADLNQADLGAPKAIARQEYDAYHDAVSSLHYPTPDLIEGPTRLRKWTLDDVACIAEASTDSPIPEGTTVPATYSSDAARAFIERQWSRLDNGEGLSLAISSALTSAAIGLIVLTLRPQNGVAGVGYWVVPSQRGHGHARRAVRLFTQWALSHAGLSRVEAWVEPDNSASRHVLTSAGFEHEGTLRSFLSFPTRRADAMVFSYVAAP
jgi:ribosomal-protein-alanine N-acetyltransferase